MLCDGSGELKYGWACRGCLNCQGADDEERDMEAELRDVYRSLRDKAVSR